MGLQRIDSLLGAAELRTLSAAARRIRLLEHLYRAAAPGELAAASRVKACKAGTLVVVADNAAVAAKLRQMTGRLLAAVRESAPDVDALRIEVDVSGSAYEDRRGARQSALGRDAVENFAALAQRMPQSSLKKALADLVKHHSSRTERSSGG